MTQAEMIKVLADESGLKASQVKSVLEALGAMGMAVLAEGGDLPLPGLGKLQIKESAERQGRNPQTGEKMQIPARKGVKFVAGKGLKEALQ